MLEGKVRRRIIRIIRWPLLLLLWVLLLCLGVFCWPKGVWSPQAPVPAPELWEDAPMSLAAPADTVMSTEQIKGWK